MTRPSSTRMEKGDTAELAGGKAGELDRIAGERESVTLRIVEIDLLEKYE